MKEFTVKVYKLDNDDNRTETVLYEETVEADSKIHAYNIVGARIKANGIHQAYKHYYTMAID
jgi:hypothetical protein